MRGGIEKALSELSRIISRNHDVHVVCPVPRAKSPHGIEPKVAFHYAPVREVRDYPIRDRLDLSVEGILLSIRFVFATIVTSAYYLDLYRRHAFDVTYLSDKHVAVSVLWMLRRRRHGVFVFGEHNIWPWLHAEPSPGWARLRYRVSLFLGRLACQLSDSVHVNSQSLQDAMAEKGVDRRLLFPIPNGTDVPAEGFVTTPLSSPIRVAFVGRLSEEKGIKILVDAILGLNARQPDIQFEIFGDGPLRSLVLDAGLQNCTLWGERPRGEVLEALRNVHIALFLSPVENIPSVALMEALALGKAIVVTDVGDTSRFLSHERNAYLCKPEPLDVSNAVTALCGNHGLYSTITEGAQALAASYSWEKIARRHLALFTSTLSLGAV